MKKLVLCLMVAMVAISGNKSFAQSNEWQYINSYDGIAVYQKVTQELRDQFCSKLRFVNNNSYNVTISFTPWFRCADGREVTESSMMLDIKAGGEKAGNWAGLFFYPCGGKERPQRLGYRELRVTQQ